MSAKDKICLVIDGVGLHVEMALRLLRDCKEVYYCLLEEGGTELGGKIGDNMDGLKRVGSPWNLVDKVDFIVCPDTGSAELVEYLKAHNYPVAGPGSAEVLETDRMWSRKYQREQEMPTQATKHIVGIPALKEYLKDKKDMYVKVDNEYRCITESFKHNDFKASEQKIKYIDAKVGPYSDEIGFVVEECLQGSEPGMDGITFDGELVFPTMAGYERCFDEQTEILTDSGWKYFKDLDKTEKVLTLDISDKGHYKSSFQKPSGYVHYPYNGKMLKVENTSVDLLVTPNHNLLVQIGEQNTKTGFLLKNKINSVFTGRKERILIQADQLDLTKPFKMPFPTSTGHIVGEKKNTYIRVAGRSVRKKDFAVFLGLYLSEGSVSESGYIIISQFKYVTEFGELLSKLPFKFKRIKSGWGFYDKPLADYLRQFGKSGDKYVPDFIKKGNRHIIKAFLNAYCLGDGSFKEVEKLSNRIKTYKKRTSRIYYTKSKRMANDLQELMLLTGSTSIVKGHTNRKEAYVIAESSAYNKHTVSPGQANWVDFSGDVYCVSVPSSIIMIRRNGKPLWCGNCKKGYVTRVYNTWDEYPEPYKEIHEGLAPEFKKRHTRFFYSTEIMLGKDRRPFLIDPTLRLASPCTFAVQLELIGNYTEVVYGLATGERVVPKMTAKYGAGIPFESKEIEKDFVNVIFPKELRQWIKLSTACKVGSDYYAIPNTSGDPLGSVVAIGNTVQEALDKVKERIKEVKGEGICFDEGGFDKIPDDIADGKRVGISF